MKNETFTVHSSHGTIIADKKTGLKVAEHLHDYSDPFVKNIVEFDVNEYRATYGIEMPYSVDILDIGYWIVNSTPLHNQRKFGVSKGLYEAPCADWRQECKHLSTI